MDHEVLDAAVLAGGRVYVVSRRGGPAAQAASRQAEAASSSGFIMPIYNTACGRWSRQTGEIGMKLRFMLSCIALSVAFAAPAKNFRWASQGDIATQDPHGQDESFTKSFNAMIYERLIMPGKDMSPTPWLATSWKVVSPTTRVFTLRKDVKFQDGTPLTADDVVFSFERAAKSKQVPHVHLASRGSRARSTTTRSSSPPRAPTHRPRLHRRDPDHEQGWCEKNKAGGSAGFLEQGHHVRVA
jgi:hypothetical protein